MIDASSACILVGILIAARIPKRTANGKYLARSEHLGDYLAVHRSHVNQPEHYIACPQIKVIVNTGGGNQGPTVKSTNAYKASHDP
ncbi:lytic polysaccharide monooxygenase [Parathielavia hyrcaniae]|uniref:Lytic polysaccharide monooxygenase n=1 Tax=Parathielavia hyrcaniae TaxID=113614 RepID=A0AAN6T2A7_9PEZI|nr:lytic polysaccharide monooxygenase [Parathielavia hyrcaniae]